MKIELNNVSSFFNYWGSSVKKETPSAALLQAIKKGEIHEIEKFLQEKDPLSQKLANGELPLHYAIRCGNTETVEKLLQSPYTNLDLKDDQGLTPLDHTFLSNNHEKINLVLSHLIKRQLEESQIALSSEKKRRIASSIREMKNILKEEQITSIDHNDTKGRTALHYACMQCDMHKANKLIDLGLNPLKEDGDGITSLMIILYQAQKHAKWVDPNQISLTEVLLCTTIIATWIMKFGRRGILLPNPNETTSIFKSLFHRTY